MLLLAIVNAVVGPVLKTFAPILMLRTEDFSVPHITLVSQINNKVTSV